MRLEESPVALQELAGLVGSSGKGVVVGSSGRRVVMGSSGREPCV